MNSKPNGHIYQNWLLLALLMILSFPIQSKAQILPPELICIENDTLVWKLPNNNCGPFNSYQIFESTSKTGPYALLANITDSNKTKYFLSSPVGQTRYFYMLSDYDCPGQMAIPSDTLDNLSPEISPIERVSVENGAVEISWIPSPSPEVTAHIIYRNTPAGTIPIDTFFTGTNYIDTQAAPDSKSESYFVVALDDCGNNSIFDNPHNTILLTTSVDSCNQTISLNWNLYQNWPNGIGSQEVWLSINGEASSKVATLFADATNYVYENANDGDEYCIYVKAVEDGSLVASKSNEVCQTLDIVQPIRKFVLVNASVTPEQNIELSWMWNTNAEINTVKVLTATQNANYAETSSEAIRPPLALQVDYLDEKNNPANGPLYYTIQTIDDCGKTAQSTHASTIHLSGVMLPSRSNFLQWTELDIENAFVDHYELFKITGAQTNLVASLTPNELNYEDIVTADDAAEGRSCYFIIAYYSIALTNGDVVELSSRSNTFCIDQEATVYVPNAFAPRGRNQVFLPVITFGQAAAFEMQIFNRWGQQIFSTNSLSEGWDGKVDGNEPKMGAYVYVIKVTQPSGNVIEKKGVVVLLQ